MNYIHPHVIVLNGGTLLTTDKSDPRAMHNSPYQETIVYINGFLNTSVELTNRHGMSIVIPPDPPRNGRYNGVFVIRREIVIESRCMQSVISSLARLDDQGPDTNTHIRALKRMFSESGEPIYERGRFIVHLDTGVTLDDIRKGGGIIYLDEADMMLSIMSNNKRAIHPHSLEFRRSCRLLSHLEEHKDNNLFYKIEIVDNYGTCGPRFVRIGADIFSIMPIKDPIRRDGVYVTKSTPTLGDLCINELRETYYTFEDGEKELLLYRSFDQAKYNKEDQLADRKLKLGEIEHETTMLKIEANKKAAEEKVLPDMMRKIIEIIKPMSVLLLTLGGGIKVIYNLGKAAGKIK